MSTSAEVTSSAKVFISIFEDIFIPHQAEDLTATFPGATLTGAIKRHKKHPQFEFELVAKLPGDDVAICTRDVVFATDYDMEHCRAGVMLAIRTRMEWNNCALKEEVYKRLGDIALKHAQEEVEA